MRSQVSTPVSKTTPANDSSGLASVTELVLSHNSPEPLPLLLPMLSYMSNHDHTRWITWIAPVGVTREQLQQYGVNTQRIRVIHASTDEKVLWLTWEALANGTSQTVIASPCDISDDAIKQLEHAAQQGNTHCLLLRQR